MDGRLGLLIWPDYVSPATLAQFENESGMKCELEIVPGAVELMDGFKGAQPPDVVVPPD